LLAQDLETEVATAPADIGCYPWYALRVKARHEESVSCGLRERGYADFLPSYTSTRRWSDRIRKMDMPLFPGYLFCRFDFGRRLPILTTPGVMHVVGMGNLPTPVDEQEISALQAVVKSGLMMQPWPFLRTGHRVTIEDGPLRNVEGIVSEMKDGHKLVLSVTLLQRSVAVNVDRAWIRPLDA
jgi:transcription antitermination factor NusG